jgi:hypothetical protein
VPQIGWQLLRPLQPSRRQVKPGGQSADPVGQSAVWSKTPPI